MDKMGITKKRKEEVVKMLQSMNIKTDEAGGFVKEDVYTHCIRAIENVLNKGVEPFPKIGIGDWNDGFSTVGNNGKGESAEYSLYQLRNHHCLYERNP